MVFRCTNPVHTNRVDRELNRLFSSFFGEPRQSSAHGRLVAVNVWENDDVWLLEAELPGVAPDQLDISVLNDELTISIEHPESQVDGATYYRRERPRGKSSRTLQLPSAIDASGVKADLKRGILTLTLPKSEATRRRRIEVNAGD